MAKCNSICWGREKDNMLRELFVENGILEGIPVADPRITVFATC